MMYVLHDGMLLRCCLPDCFRRPRHPLYHTSTFSFVTNERERGRIHDEWALPHSKQVCALEGGHMFRIDTPDATSDNRFTEGDPTIPIEATTVSADWLNSVQEEIISVLANATIELNKESTTQLYDAIMHLIQQRINIATPDSPGVVKPDGETISIDAEGRLFITPKFAAFKDFFEQTPPKGWAVRDGSVLENAKAKYTDLWDHLNDTNNAWKNKTLDQWSALSRAASGIGGVPFFVLNETENTIKLPDTRTDHIYGNVGASIGQWEGDAMRNLTGNTDGYFNFMTASGVFSHGNYTQNIPSTIGTFGYHQLLFNAALTVPTAGQFRPRRISLLPCVYIGGN